MRYFSQKLGKKFKKHIFRALEWKVWRFVSVDAFAQKHKKDISNVLKFKTLDFVYKNRLFINFTCALLCVLVVFNHQIFASDLLDTEPVSYEYQTVKILPGTVTSNGWEGTLNTLSQEEGDDSLFDSFNKNNSAYPVKFVSNVSDANIQNSAVQPASDSIQNNLNDQESIITPEQSLDNADNIDTTETASQIDSIGNTNTDTVSDTVEEQSPEQAPDTSAQSLSETPLQALSKSFFRFVSRTVDLLPLAQESVVTPIENVVPNSVDVGQEAISSQPVSSTIAPDESIDSVQAQEEQSVIPQNDIELDAHTSQDPVVENPTLVDQPVEAENSATDVTQDQVVDEALGEGDSLTPTEQSSSCAEGSCVKHVIEFGDFSVGENDAQQITNMQLRVSIGARPNAHIDASNERIRIEYLHYDEWIDGGTIDITDEVSNAINGGTYLFGFPLYSEWDEMKRIKVRLTYESDNEHLSEIYVDSVWLEVESIDNNAFNDPDFMVGPDSRTHAPKIRNEVPEGYVFSVVEDKDEYSKDEDARFAYKVEKDPASEGIFTKIGNEVKKFFGMKVKDKNRFTMHVINEELRHDAQVTENNGEFSIEIPKSRQFKPGKHIVTVEVTDGTNTFYVDKEFLWGVLALNTDKSIYAPNETAYLQMGVLDDFGHTICDAKLDLEIIDAQGTVHNLSTEDGTISYGKECAGDSYTTSPDYDVYLALIAGVGKYQMKLTATTENGVHTINDSFEVQENVAFDVARTGPTRIYPVEEYPVTLTITAKQDYVGSIVEYVPQSFQVREYQGYSGFRTHEEGDAKQIIWNVNIKAGETVTLGYYFDAPDISPEFYLTGPLTIGSFKEIRQWQIASDAPDNAIIVQSVMGTPTSATTYSATFGSTPTSGNTIIMIAAHRDSPRTFNAPASYMTQAVLSHATVEEDIGIWYAPADSATTTYSITKTGGNQTGVVYLMEVSGLDTSNLLNATSSNDQTATNAMVAYTGQTATTSKYALAVAGIIFGDNDFAVPTSASWSSDSTNAYTQQNTVNWATGNDGTLSIATANINVAARQGATQTLTVGGTEQRNSVLAVFNLKPQIATVGTRGNQESQLKINTQNNYVGGMFTVIPSNGYATVTSMTITETGTTNAAVDLSNIRLKYELDTVAPYDCASATYDGTDLQYGATSTAFSSANGTSTFTGSLRVSTTSVMCAYVVLDVDSSATPNDTLELQISTPNTQVVMSEGSTTPGTAIAISDTTILRVGYTPTQPAFTNSPMFDSMRSTTTQPTFGGFVSTDRDGDLIEYEFSLDDDPYFGSPDIVKYSYNYPTDAGWASTTFASGATTTYTVQTPLTVGQTYWWRVRARDPYNTNDWSEYSTYRSVTISNAITIPEWFETTGYQMATSTTFSNATATGLGSAEIENLYTSVSLLDAFSTGNTKTISSGSNRLLMVAIISEDSGTDVNVGTVTYGGKTLTELTDQQIGTGFSNGMWVGYLNEAGIASSSGTTIVPTWTGSGTPTPNNGIQYISAVFEDVNQLTPIRDYSPNALTAGTNITPTSAIDAVDGDMMMYFSETANGLTHTPSTGYTEGTEQDTGGTGFVDASAYKAITADGSEYPTAQWSASGNRLLMVAVDLQPSPAEATIMSPQVYFNWVPNQPTWGEVMWTATEPAGSFVKLKVYYSSTTACDTLVPNAVLAGNSTGFGTSSSPINISSLSTTTYSRICLQATLSEGTAGVSPTLDDWDISWQVNPHFDQKAYWWYVNSTSTTPTNTWPPNSEGTELTESQPITTNRAVKYGEVLRLRMGLEVSTVTASSKSFKLQYAPGTTCGLDMAWTDVAPIGSTTALWRGYNNSGISDGATLSASVLASSDTLETYEEENNSTAMPNSVSVGNQGEWDWAIENRAEAGTSYCFRMARTDGTALATYTQYPQLITNKAPEIISMDVPFDNEKLASTTPYFDFLSLDTEGDSVDYQIQIDNNADFSSTIIDTDSGTNLYDFENIETTSDKSPFNQSQVIRFTSPTSFSNNTTYWWRVRAIDPSGSNQYGAWSTAQSFTIDTSVTISTWLQTTQEQFDTDTLEGTDATASNLVTFASGSTTGTTTSSRIHFDLGRSGNAWGQFSFTETGSANDILYHIEYLNGDTWELVPDADLSGNAAGYDTSPISLIDLNTATYNEIRIRANFRAGSPTLTDWMVEWGERVSVPTHLLLFDNEKTGTTTPTFTFYTTDPQNDDLQYEFSYSTDDTFTTSSTTVNSSTSPGFSNVTSGIGDTNPYNSGDTISYKVQSALTNGTTYWWRVRAKDPNGGNNYSFWSTPWSFTIDTNATTSTWFQTTKEQFETDTLTSLYATTSNAVSTIPAGVTTYNFVGITNPSATHVARYFRVSVNDPTDPPTGDAIDTLTVLGTPTSIPNLRTAIAGHATDAEATNAQYTAISTSNNTRWTTTDPGNGNNADFWTEFHISESPANITKIEVLVEGYQGGTPPGTDKAWMGIWRPGSTTPYWQNLTASQQTSDYNYTGTITTNISQYFDGNNNIHVIFHNEDDSDPVVVDYVEVKITTATADSGTLVSSPVTFTDGSGPVWGEFSWSDSEPGLSSLLYQLEYLTPANTWSLIPDAALSGNSSGFGTSPVDLRLLNTSTYGTIRAVGNFSCYLTSCPTLNDWTIKWSPGFTITGTAYEYDGVSSTTSGTVAVAVNGVLQTGKIGTIQSNGTWSIANVTFFPGDIVTVFVDGATDANEAVAVTKYDGVPDMSGLKLQKRHLSIGSDDYGVVTNADLALYDYTNDEDLFFDVNAGNDLTLCADATCGDAGIVILPYNTFSPGTGGDVTTHDIKIDGTLVSGGNTMRVSGSWDNNATTTMTGSTVIFTATSTTETVDSTGALTYAFNNATFGETSGTATWTLGSVLDIDNVCNVTYGTLARGTHDIVIGGNLTIGAAGFWTGIGTTTFDGINPTTWTDQNGTKQNVGRVVVDGTSKTTVLGSNVLMQSMYIGANDAFDLSVTGHTASVYGDWINTNSFLARTGTISFIATTTNHTISNNNSGFYNLSFNGVGGSWSFTTPSITVSNNLTIATGTVTMPTGTTTVTGSFTNTGGTFAHNNGLVLFNASGAKTITLSGTPFTNAFHNVRFSGSGSWSFTEANATTSNDFLITQGTVTMPSTRLTVLGDFLNTAGSFVHNNGTIDFGASSAKSIDTNASFYSLVFTGSGTWSFVDTSITALGSVSALNGTLILPSGTTTIGGSYTNTATVTPSSGVVLFNSTDIGETVNFGNSSLYNVVFNSSTGGWTITSSGTTTNDFTLTALSSFTLGNGNALAVNGHFTNSVGGASTTWTGSTLSLESGTYSLNAKTNTGDAYGTLRIKPGANIQMWNSTSTVYSVDSGSSLYSMDHNAVDGSLYIFGTYVRTTGTEYWNYATDFDGTALGGSPRQVNVHIAENATARFTGGITNWVGITSATTTIDNQGTGTYAVEVTGGTLNAQYYQFRNLNASGLVLSGTTTITSLSDGDYVPVVASGSGITVSSTTIDQNPGLQISRVSFATTSGISTYNVSQVDGNPSSYWWFRYTSGNINGESFDNDTGDPGSVRWDDSSLVISVSGTVYNDDGTTALLSPTCDDVTQNVRVKVQGGGSHTGSCSSVDGSFTVGGVVITGSPVLTVYLDTNGGDQGVVVTKTPTQNITDLAIYRNRIMTRHEDVAPLTIADMAVFDASNDSDIRFDAATGTIDTLYVYAGNELHIASSTTFAPSGDVTISANASSSSQDGSLHIDNNAHFIGSATSTYTIGGSLVVDSGATFTYASTSVVFNATTTGKTITSEDLQEITFNNLQFNGGGGGWNMNTDVRAKQNLYVTTGTVSGTKNITIENGSLSGNGTLSLGSGTTTIEKTNTLGGTTPWTFANLVLGSGSVVGTTTPASNATTTVLGKLTINTGHFLNAGGSYWDLSGSGNVLVENGNFVESTSTVRYSGTGSTNILSTAYYNLVLKAQGGSPTYTGTGLGITVLNNMIVGAGTTVNFDTSDPLLDVNGSFTIENTGTFIGSGSASTTIAGDWSNSGTFTPSGGTITFDGGSTTNVNPGSSSFANVKINGAGSVTIADHATATAAFSIINTGAFTVSSGKVLSVGTTFSNLVSGALTTWTGSTLHLYGGGNYAINASTTSDTYNILDIGSGTQIRMWNSSASTYSLSSTASLYSQNNANVSGDLYIYGAYTKSSGTDYWNYTTDFDGTPLGSPRVANVHIASGGSALYIGGGLSVIGAAGATTTIQNQGSGTYSIRIGGTASTTWSYYALRNMDTSGLTFSGTPTVTTLSHGDFEVSQNNGTAMTVGGTVINQNQAKTFTANRFETSGASPAYNVTATGTSISSWRFTGYVGSIAGEANDVDPTGDPGYVVWDDSAALITVAGKVYSDEGVTVSTICDNSTPNILLRVAGLTGYSTSCSSADGSYSISNVAFSPSDSLVVYIGGETQKAASVTEDPVSSISNLDLYENRVIVRHEGVDPLSILDMSYWDSPDDTDVPFTAVDSSPDTLTLPANFKLIVWQNKTFTPGGNVTVPGGGGGSAYDGTVEIQTGATFTATGAETHTIGGSLISGSGATFNSDTSTFIFTTSGSARTVDTNEYPFYSATFNGTGSWTVTNTAFELGNDLTITKGAVTLPSGTTTISGSLAVTGGSFNANSGSIFFNSSGSETITASTSSFSRVVIDGTGSFAFQGTNATATAGLRIENGNVTSVSGVFTIGNDFINDGTFHHNNGTLRMTSVGVALVTASSSDLGSVTFDGGGAYSFTDDNLALLGSLTINGGSVRLASGTMSIAGSFTNNGGTFDNATGTILFNSSDTGETIKSGGSVFHTLVFGSSGGGWTMTDNATTTGNFTITNASNFTVSSSTNLTVLGIFTNSVGGGATAWTGSTLRILSGTGYTVNSKTAGGDVYANVYVSSSTALRFWDSSGTFVLGDTGSSIYSQDHAGVSGALNIYGNYVRATGSDYWSYATDFDGTALGGSSRQVHVYFAPGATTTLTGGSLAIVGTATYDTMIDTQGSGTYGLSLYGGTLNAQYYSLANLGVSGLVLSGDTTVTSLSEGNFTLAVNGGSLITVSSTTINYNAGLTITGASFATTTAITGYNVNVVGTTASAWTFVSHTGNFDGESFDNDGGDDCGSIRWSDSVCLLTLQSAYRWRNNDAGEGVPDSEWFDVDWTKRRRVTITNADATQYTNASIKLTVLYDADMQADFDDLRFTLSDGVTPVSHFIETYTPSTDATVWVKLPTFATSTDTEIYMYYSNGTIGDGSATTTFGYLDTFEDGNITEYSGDTTLFTAGTGFSYERTRGLDAAGHESSKATDGIYRTDVTVSQGQTIRYMQYVDTSAGSGDETCTLFAVQSPGSNNQNYGVCLELFGVDRVSISRDVDNNDTSGVVIASTTISYTTGWHEVEIDWKTNNTINVTVSRGGSVVATTSATDSTYTSGGVGFTFWFQNGGWDIFSSRTYIATTPTFTIGGEQVPGGATWLAALNTSASGIQVGDTARLRFVVENTGLPVVNQNYEIEYAPKGISPSCEAVNPSSFVAVPNVSSCGTSGVCMTTSSQFVDQDPTTDLLGGNGTFVSGQMIEDPSTHSGNITLNGDEYTELEYAISLTSNVTDSNYCFRVTNLGTDLDSYTHIAELGLRFAPNITSISFNDGIDINLVPGATTTIHATGTVTDLNGYSDIVAATTTMFRSGVGSSCTEDPNNCYRAGNTQCSFFNCSGNSCDVSCSADFYYHADPTDIGTYAAESWGAMLEVSDQSGSVATQTAPYVDLVTLRAISVDSSINYGTLEVGSSTGSYNASTTIENIGNDSLDISLEGTDLSDGGSSLIPVTYQHFATSTFNYSSCVYCSSLSSSASNYKVDLAKPVSTTPSVTDELFWGISIPVGVAGDAHQGTNIFYAIGDF